MKQLFEIFTAPSPEALARRELIDAKRGLLQAQSTAEYANSMVLYHTNRIKRLSKTNLSEESSFTNSRLPGLA